MTKSIFNHISHSYIFQNTPLSQKKFSERIVTSYPHHRKRTVILEVTLHQMIIAYAYQFLFTVRWFPLKDPRHLNISLLRPHLYNWKHTK